MCTYAWTSDPGSLFLCIKSFDSFMVQVLEQQTPTAASSVYSFGMVMYLMLTWQIPFQDLVSNAEVCVVHGT